MMNQLHPVLNPRPAIRNLREVILAQRLLILKAERAMIGRHHLQMIVLQSIPQLGMILLLSQRRSEHILRILKALAFHVVFNRQQQILRTRLRKRRQPAVPRLPHLIQRVLARKMHDVHRNTSQRRHHDGAMHRLRLRNRGPCQRVMNRRLLALGERLLHDHVDHAAVLGVHADQRAVLGCLLHRLEDRCVIHHQHAGIRHEQLEAGHALADHVVHVFQPRRAQIRDDHVQPIVDTRLPFGLLPPRIERVAHLRALRLDGKVHNRRRPADRRRARARLKIIRRRRPAKRHVEMRMRIDPARQDEQSGSVYDRVSLGIDARAHLANRAALNQHIRGHRAVRIDYHPVLNQKTHWYLFTFVRLFSIERKRLY